MEEKKRISLNQLDVLREIGTIGAGRAATALADLLGTKVNISLPETRLVPLENLDKILGDPEKAFFVLDTGLEGDIGGRRNRCFSRTQDIAKFPVRVLRGGIDRTGY